MDDFDHILNWTLKVGSHPFPGPDGGTCINEAAIIAAGFPYQPVKSVENMPECFSRPICRLAMQAAAPPIRDPAGLCGYPRDRAGTGHLHRLAHSTPLFVPGRPCRA